MTARSRSFFTIFDKRNSLPIYGGTIKRVHFYLLGANAKCVYHQMETYDMLWVPLPSGNKAKYLGKFFLIHWYFFFSFLAALVSDVSFFLNFPGRAKLGLSTR